MSGLQQMDSYHGVSEKLDLDVVRHGQYYFSLITFQVENCLFKLPRHFFEQSDVFQGMYTIAQADTDEGTCDQHPIYLALTKREDFEAFLKVALPIWLPGHQVSQTVLSLQEWLGVLELAHKWEFKNVRQTAIETLDKHPLDVVQKIKLIQKYEIKEWTYAAYKTMLVRESALTAHEMKSLGFEFSSKIADAREKLMKKKINDAARGNNSSNWYCSSCGGTNHLGYSECQYLDCRQPKPSTDDPNVIHGVIHEVFGDPIWIL
ncbi:hypothetical protein BD410DRAFT_831033 [Rickenella mellea]|uniref:RanBP2-type domain-containing protein n=1 Tax=Rickenella mellea TaxID=50990 RepID=A0A4Y7PS40_9AGAM|nr:hypothetical protein BD410DRAFT_831033 [Rickenella mellea]